MGPLRWLQRIFAGGTSDGSDPDVLHLYVRCSHCGDKVHLRIVKQYELSRDFQQGGYYVRKVAVDQRCFRPIEVEMRIDEAGREMYREASGGEFLTREQYEGVESS